MLYNFLYDESMIFHAALTKWFLLMFSIIFFTSTAILCAYILSIGDCTCQPCNQLTSPTKGHSASKNGSSSLHKLAVLVPHRDRFPELVAFTPHMAQFLNRQNIDFEFFIMNQIDELRFNRASLINVGFKLMDKQFDYLAIHDVDLLPLRDELSYDYPLGGVYHVSSPQLHPKYHYPTFLGGILIIKREDYQKVNGMSNRYWGWGLEDDEFYTRLKDAQIQITRPSGVPTNSSNTFLHTHSRERRRDTRKCFAQVTVTRRRDRVTGLHDVKYVLHDVIPMTIRNVPLTMWNIELLCDRDLTPWCQCDPPPVPAKKAPS